MAFTWAAGGTIYRWDYEQAALDTVALQWKEPSRAFFNRMARWNERYWVLSSRWNGLWLLDRRTGVIDRPDFCREKEIMAMEVDHRGNLWISPYGKGIDRYGSGGRVRTHYDVSNSALTNDVILDIVENDDQLWLATDGGGISILNYNDNTFSNIRYVPGDVYSFRSVRSFASTATATATCGRAPYGAACSVSRRCSCAPTAMCRPATAMA